MMKTDKKFNDTKKSPPLFMLFSLIFIVAVLYFIYRVGLYFEPTSTIEYSGYAVSGKELVENLLRADLNGKKYLEPLKIEEDSTIYKKVSTYYVGEDKKDSINLDYPIFVNNNTTLLNVLGESKFITTDLEELDGYKDSLMTDGNLYNLLNLERADYNDYLFIKNSDNLYISLKDITIKTLANTYVIPKNSIINFSENYITYYHMVDNTFKYETIVDVSLESEISVKTSNYKMNFVSGEVSQIDGAKDRIYKDFLLILNIIKEKKNNVKSQPEPEPEEKVVKVKENIIIIQEPEEVGEIKEIEETNEPENVQENNQQLPINSGNEGENTNQGNEGEENPSEPEYVWIEPKVRAAKFEANVYTTSSKISIYDPARTIKTAIIFEIYKNDKIYMRNQVVSSGNLRIGVLEPDTEYKIIGTYRYTTEDKKTIEVEFVNQTIKTKPITELKPLGLAFETENIFTNKIEISNMKLTTSISETSETIAGIRRAEVYINGRTFSMNSAVLRRILSGQEASMQFQGNISANTEYEFEIVFYDIANNKITVLNNTGKTRTSMQTPSVKLKKTSTKKSLDVEFSLTYKNPNNVEIKNQKYVVYSNDEIVAQGEVTSDKIVLKNMEFASYYTINIYGDYNLNDNKPDVIEGLLGTDNFVTAEINDFGNIYVDASILPDDITDNSAIFRFNINTTSNKTNTELVKMIKQMKIILSSDNNVVKEIPITEENLSLLKQNVNISLDINNINSDTEYNISIEALAEAGNDSKTLTAIISGTKRFITLKKEAILNIKNLFILNNIIDFDINIYDKDGAARSTQAILEVISTRDEVVQRNEIQISKTPEEYTRIQITDLLENEKYYLSLLIDEYSIRHEESTIKPKYFEFSGDEKRISSALRKEQNVGVVWTNNIGGNITLETISRKNTGTNLVDPESEVNWYSECFNTKRGYLKEYDKNTGILKLGVGAGTSQIYVYDILSSYEEYNGELLDISLKFKKSNSDVKFYIQNGTDFENNKVEEIPENMEMMDEDEWYTFNLESMGIDIGAERYIGFQISGSSDSFVEIRELEIKLKTEEPASEEEEGVFNAFKYEVESKFRLNLNLYNEDLMSLGYQANITNGIYYIRIKDHTTKEVEELKYDAYSQEAMDDNGDDRNSIENLLKSIDLVENRYYEMELIVKHPTIQEREYILNTIIVDTSNKEIKNISNVQEYLEIQPKGSYIFSKDIDLVAGDYRFGNENLSFDGYLDFNGKTVNRVIEMKEDENYKHYLFYKLSENAVIENLNFNIGIDLRIGAESTNTNVEISRENSGLVFENLGTIRNIIVNLRTCTASPIQKFALIGYTNRGTLQNFVIYLRSNFYLGGEGALGFVRCEGGTIKNGYITPTPYRDYAIKPINCNDAYKINIGALASHVIGSQINNVYSLVRINNEDENANNLGSFYAGNLIAETLSSNIKNVYSVEIGNITAQNNENETVGPTIAYPYNPEDSNIVRNSYFFNDANIRNNEYNTKVNMAALSNIEFQNNLLNSEDSEKQFIVDSKVKTYFPKVILSDVMPAQYNIPMKKTTTTDADIISINPIEDGDLEKLVEITVFNPKGAKITKIELDGLETEKYRVHDDNFCEPDSIFEKCSGRHDAQGYCLDSEGNRIPVEEDGFTQKYLSGQTTKVITKIRIPTRESYDEQGFDNRQYVSKYYVKSVKADGYDEKLYLERKRNNIK